MAIETVSGAKKEADKASRVDNRFSPNSNLVEEVEFQGRKHLKVPAVALKETVLDYPEHNTREFVPEEELQRTLQFWNNTPFVIEHPRMNGRKVSANVEPIADKEEVGRVFADKVNNGKLHLNVLIDINRAEKSERGQQLLESVNNGKEIDLSTSYHKIDDPESGTFNGQSFDLVQRWIIPDHLAAIMEGRARCKEGVGLPRRNSIELDHLTDEDQVLLVNTESDSYLLVVNEDIDTDNLKGNDIQN